MYRIGIDVGGTFTDLVAVDDFGQATLAKVPSTPDDPSIGVLDGLKLLADTLGLDLAALLMQTERIVHGTTVATNALLERKGARVGLLTTEGHRDIIEMREGLKDDRYNLRLPPPEQLVPRKLRLGVSERLRADGRVETSLDSASLDRELAVLRQENVEAVAVCYLHAYRDPSHERATREAVERALPDIYVSLSSEVLPQIKGIREGLDDRRQCLCRPGLVALSDPARIPPLGSRISRPDPDHPITWRGRADRRVRAPGRGSRALRPGGWRRR
jgi:N-methylhydantoinase A